MNNKVSQSVPHLHTHVVPRTKGDGLRGFFWPRTQVRVGRGGGVLRRADRKGGSRGSRVVVTGGSGKLGRAVVADLAAHGYEVVNIDRVARARRRGAGST